MKNPDFQIIKQFIEPYIARALQNETFGVFKKASLIAQPFIKKQELDPVEIFIDETPLLFIVNTDTPGFQLLFSLVYNYTTNTVVRFLSLERDTNSILEKSKEISERVHTATPFFLIDGFMSETKVIEVTDGDTPLFFPTDERFNALHPLTREKLTSTSQFKNL